MADAQRSDAASPPIPSHLPARVRTALAHGLRAVPGERFASTHELLARIDLGVNRRRPWLVAVGAALIAAGATAWLVGGRALPGAVRADAIDLEPHPAGRARRPPPRDRSAPRRRSPGRRRAHGRALPRRVVGDAPPANLPRPWWRRLLGGR
jgi:hypothetical protein